MKPRAFLLSLSAIVVFATFLGPGPHSSSGQEPKKKFGAILCCDLPIYVSDGWVGTSRKISCRDYLNNASEDERSRVCAQMKNGKAFSKAECLRDYSGICPDAKPEHCDDKNNENMPWFDPTNPGCIDKQETKMVATWSSVNGGTCTITLTACNSVVLTKVIDVVDRKNGQVIPADRPVNNTREEDAAAGFSPIKRSECTPAIYRAFEVDAPHIVCCDLWNEAVAAGSGCNPEKDADCDGLPNEQSPIVRSTPYLSPEYPESFYGPRVDAPNIDPRPAGLGWDEMMPNEACKFCKWFIVSGKLTCSPDKKKDHQYKVTWLCPLSGVTRVVTKTAPPTARCTPPR